MNRIADQLVSCFLMLSITASVFPFHLLHQHQEEIICDQSDAALEEIPCHVSVYHADQFKNAPCDHRIHISKEFDHCELCKFLTSNRNNYLASSYEWFNPIFQSRERIIFKPSIFPITLASDISNRGPPA